MQASESAEKAPAHPSTSGACCPRLYDHASAAPKLVHGTSKPQSRSTKKATRCISHLPDAVCRPPKPRAVSPPSNAAAHHPPHLSALGTTHAQGDIAPQDPRTMSKTPLLLRSSPAQGTGSYGALPVHMLSTSNESSADESTHDLDHVMRTGKRKAKSNLRDADTITEEEAESSKAPRNRTASDGRLLDDKGTKRSRRKSLPAVNLPDDHPSAVEAWVGSLEGEMESGLEGRFNSKAGMPSAAPVTEDTPSDSFQSDSSEAIDIDGSEDGGSEVGGQVRDKAAEESPPDDSPYPQVRAAVRPSDDTSLSINTPRMWTLSMLFSILGSSTNLFFSLRYPSVSITPVIALLLVHPIGLLWDQLLKRPDDPAEVFTNGSIHHRAADAVEYGSSNGAINLQDHDGDGSMAHGEKKRSWTRSLRLWLAQGKWNEKEHCCVYISSNVSFGFAFATDVSLPSV